MKRTAFYDLFFFFFSKNIERALRCSKFTYVFFFLFFSFPLCRPDKLDSSFSRSRSSSMSSLDNITTESIQCLTFGDSYTKKSGTYNEFFERPTPKTFPPPAPTRSPTIRGSSVFPLCFLRPSHIQTPPLFYLFIYTHAYTIRGVPDQWHNRDFGAPMKRRKRGALRITQLHFRRR